MDMHSVIAWHRARPHLAIGVHILICFGLLGYALYTQFALGLQPCVLCLWQRIPYAIIAIIALIALLLENRWIPVLLAAIATLYLVEAGIAFYHVGVEERWWASAAGCGFKPNPQGDLQALYLQIVKMPTTPCDAKSWVFLGLSMAGWNTILATLLAAFSAAQSALQRPWSSAKR